MDFDFLVVSLEPMFGLSVLFGCVYTDTPLLTIRASDVGWWFVGVGSVYPLSL